MRGVLADGYFERASGDVVRTPPDRECMVSLLVGLVADGVHADFGLLVRQLRDRVARRRDHSQRQQRLACNPAKHQRPSYK